jgi:hypothetical protein
MLSSRRASSVVRQFVRQFAYNSQQSSRLVTSRRPYDAADDASPKPKVDPRSGPLPLSGPLLDELDPRFSDLPPWNVPPVNRQDLTETPAEPYYDQQARRYYGEPVRFPLHLPLGLYSK